MKTTKTIFVLGLAVISLSVFVNGCMTTKEASEATGSQLWSENCGRCHYAPPSSTYSADQWEVLCMHMKSRTMIPDRDVQKIVEFLKSGQ